MKSHWLAWLAVLGAALPARGARAEANKGAGPAPAASIYEIPLTTIEGRDTTLAAYRGEVLLIVNVASKCGYTPQYAGLQALHERYASRGLRVLGFPANDFGGQEQGGNDEIQAFCRLNYGVGFPLFAKLSAKGKGMHPLFRHLTAGGGDPALAGEIPWNFSKFLVDRAGRLVARFDARTAPSDAALVEAIEKALGAGSDKPLGEGGGKALGAAG